MGLRYIYIRFVLDLKIINMSTTKMPIFWKLWQIMENITITINYEVIMGFWLAYFNLILAYSSGYCHSELFCAFHGLLTFAFWSIRMVDGQRSSTFRLRKFVLNIHTEFLHQLDNGLIFLERYIRHFSLFYRSLSEIRANVQRPWRCVKHHLWR